MWRGGNDVNPDPAHVCAPCRIAMCVATGMWAHASYQARFAGTTHEIKWYTLFCVGFFCVRVGWRGWVVAVHGG